MKLQKDIHEFIALLLSRKVEFLLVGGYALAFHGAPRFTEDIDFLVLLSPENAGKLVALLDEFGFGELGLSSEDFLDADQVIQLGRAPNRIDLLTGISGVTWDQAWNLALEANKMATGRPQDLADVARLRKEA
jgi:hypothetical protein